jgi:hypothetical protein
MSDALARYRELEGKLLHTRWVHGGLESSEEDDLLEEMDGVWWELAPEEHALLNSEGSKTLIRDRVPATRTTVDVDVWSYSDLPPRGREAA